MLVRQRQARRFTVSVSVSLLSQANGLLTPASYLMHRHNVEIKNYFLKMSNYSFNICIRELCNDAKVLEVRTCANSK